MKSTRTMLYIATYNSNTARGQKKGITTVISTNYCSMATAPSSSNSGRAGDLGSNPGFGVDLAVGGLDDVGDVADLQPGPDAAQHPLPTPHLPRPPRLR